jgi:hypothetical protein
MKVIHLFITAILFLVTTRCLAQEPEMADTMRSEGKMYVVVSIVLIVLLGLIGYLFFVDRKVSRLERSKNGNTQ